MDYWDTSALAKLYLNEADSALFSARVSKSAPLLTSDPGRLCSS